MMKLLRAAWPALVIWLSFGAAHAASEPQRGDPGTIDMTVPLKDTHGKPLRDVGATSEDDKPCAKVKDNLPDVEACPVLTLGRAVSNVLYANFKEDANLDPRMRAARVRLADKLIDDSAARLTAAQITLIETLLGRNYNGLVLSQTYSLLQPNLELPEVK